MEPARIVCLEVLINQATQLNILGDRSWFDSLAAEKLGLVQFNSG
jgi:hypothetical protein